MSDLVLPRPGDLALTVKQPFADLELAGVKDVENRTWAVPSTLPQWYRCTAAGCTDRRRPRHHLDGCDVAAHEGLEELDGPFPFRLWIHAAATVEPKRSPLWKRGGIPADSSGIALDWARWASLYAPHARRSSPLANRLGVLLGTVEVTGCHHARECLGRSLRKDPPQLRHCSRWAQPDCWHWTLATPEPLDTPIPAKGALGLWRILEGVAA